MLFVYIIFIVFVHGVQFSLYSNANDQNKIVVVIPSYKNAQFYKDNLGSVLSQNYNNFSVLYTADGDLLPDSDNTGTLAKEYVKELGQEHRVTIIQNRDRQLALRNWYKAILSCDDEDIIVALDGDDALAHPDVLSHINALYNNKDKEIWFTYGNFKVKSTGEVWQHTQAIPDDIIKSGSIRKWGNGPTHLKTFKAWLFKAVPISHFFYDHDFYTMSADIAMYTPMIEKAAYHYAVNHTILHEYNDINPLNDHKIDRSLQIKHDAHVRARPALKPLTQSLAGALDKRKRDGALVADLIIFSDNTPDELEYFLSHALSTITNTNSVCVLYRYTSQTQEGYEALKANHKDTGFYGYKDRGIDFRRALASCYKHRGKNSCADYICCVSDQIKATRKKGITDALMWLERTHAHFFCMAYNKQDIQAIGAYPLLISLFVEDPLAVYAWRISSVCAQYDLFSGLCLQRRKDGEFLATLPLVVDFKSLSKIWAISLKDSAVGLVYATS